MRLNSIKILCCLVFLSAFACLNNCFSEESFPFLGEVNGNKINLRADSRTSSEIICILEKSEKVEVVASANDWYKVRLPKRAACYIKASFLECLNYEKASTSAGLPQTEQKTKCLNAKALKDRINIRLGPNESTPILGTLDINEVVNILEETSGWAKIEPIQNSFGWVYKKFVNRTGDISPAVTIKPNTSLPVNTEKNPTNEIITVEGIIKPYGKVFNRAATHKLFTKNNEIFLLKGNKKSLESLNFQKVKVTGNKMNLPKQKFTVIEVKNIELVN
ncbi:MAG: SH3 domain-containing protein [Candidatus Omnitrophica bacterium]|nr:SH3 domain-containing protein [Candidatus Omnitrophota bacterium]